jgi:hypothetical protein
MATTVRIDSKIVDELLRGGTCRLPLAPRSVDAATAVTLVSVAGSLSSVLVAHNSWRAFASSVVRALWTRQPDPSSASISLTATLSDGTEIKVDLDSIDDAHAIEMVYRALQSGSEE